MLFVLWFRVVKISTFQLILERRFKKTPQALRLVLCEEKCFLFCRSFMDDGRRPALCALMLGKPLAMVNGVLTAESGG